MEYKNQNIKHLVNVDQDNNVARVSMFGIIGTVFDGNVFAEDLIKTSDLGFEEIDININSAGGSVFDGFSILNAMNIIRMKGTGVRTTCVGIADSMAGLILAFGDKGKRTASSFSSSIIHEPTFTQQDGTRIAIEELEDGALKTELLRLREILLTSLSSSTGNTIGSLRKLMKQGTRRTAAELKSIGLIDQVVEVSNIVETQNKSAIELIAACSEINNGKRKIKNMNQMKLVNKTLGLNAEASEAALIDAVQTLQNRVDKAEEKAKTVDTQKLEIENLKKENEKLKTAIETQRKTAVEDFVNSQIEAGKFVEDKKEHILKVALNDFEGFKNLCESMNSSFVDVTQQITNATQNKDKVKMKKEQLIEKAKEYHAADCGGDLKAFKNKVGEKNFLIAENAYIEYMDEVTKEE